MKRTSYLILILFVVLVSFFHVNSMRQYQAIQEKLDSIVRLANQKPLPKDRVALDIYRSISNLKNFDKRSIMGRSINTVDYSIKTNALDLSDRVTLPAGWKPSINDKELGERLPFDWGKLYKDHFKQHFNPDKFYLNAIALYHYQTSSPEEEQNLVKIKDELLDRLIKFSKLQGNARYAIYSFDHKKFSGLKAPWTSGFAQGQVLSGLVYLHKRFNDTRTIKIADEIYNSFAQIRDREKDDFWITEVDEYNFLWIEEFPLKKDPQPKVINGHIWGIIGLYNYLSIRPKQSNALLLLKAAITSAHYYINNYRVPGSVNRYSLYNTKEDYSPERTIRQQFDLYTITGESYFLKMSQIFQIDYNLYKQAKEE